MDLQNTSSPPILGITQSLSYIVLWFYPHRSFMFGADKFYLCVNFNMERLAMTWYEITIAVAGAFGGVELVKYISKLNLKVVSS